MKRKEIIKEIELQKELVKSIDGLNTSYVRGHLYALNFTLKLLKDGKNE